jgi:hypothetical protein
MAATTPASLSALFTRPEPTPRERTFLQPETGWLSVLLLLALVLSTVWSIDQARWVEGTSILFPLALAGIGTGMLLARLRLAGWVALPLGLIGGAVLTFAVVGRLLPSPGAIPEALIGTIGGTIAWFGQPEGVPPLIGAVQQFGANAAEFGARVGLWSQLVSTGRVSNDNAIFLLFIGYVAWLQGLIGAWGLFGLQDVVVAALPTGIALTTNAAYTGQTHAPFAIFLITLLLLAVSVRRFNIRLE